jgi:hypothetical protein
MVLATTQQILTAAKKGQTKNYIVYGPLGTGKTSYGVNVLMEVYAKEIEKDGLVQTISQYYFHNPIEMLQLVKRFKAENIKVPVIVPDDFGVWLYALDFAKPLVKSIVKYFQMIRTRVRGGVVMTSPTPTLILGKLRCFPQTVTIKISEAPGGEQYNRPLKDIRLAKAYRSWLLPDLQKLRVHKLYEDKFSCMLPNDLYHWLEEKREDYVSYLENEIERNIPQYMKEMQMVKDSNSNTDVSVGTQSF